MVRVLGIDTSCDETALGIVQDSRGVRANVVSSSLARHAPYGGVIPEIAARAHVETIWDVLAQALEEAKVELAQIDAVAVTQGPGLPGALHIGLAFAKGLALSLERPLIAVDHLAGHLYAAEMGDESLKPPYIGLVVSGGHTILCVVHSDCRFELLGETKDDAVGEAFDKVAKLLGLEYPGGPIIDRLSEEGDPCRFPLPKTNTKQPLDFSFSGLKSAVSRAVRKGSEDLTSNEAAHTSHGAKALGAEKASLADIAAGFQESAVEILVSKTLRACQRTGLKQIVVGGGVASNRRLRARLNDAGGIKGIKVVLPPESLCVDNGAMIAGLGCQLLQMGRSAPLTITANPNMCLFS